MIPREGVESRGGSAIFRDQGIHVIPREGVERLGNLQEGLRRSREVIPREGVESLKTQPVSLPAVCTRDPERGS